MLVAQFADMDSAKIAYGALSDAEAKRAIDIEGVLVVNADYQGKIHIQKMTDHTTRNGFAWGAVAGGVLGHHLPAVDPRQRGRCRHRRRDRWQDRQRPSRRAPSPTSWRRSSRRAPSGIVALVAITAVDAVKETIPEATKVAAVPVDDTTADAVKAAAKAAEGAPAEAAPAS